MYLKSIKIQGFKSFADSINMDFEPGITAIVGPNGSGKSNIGDAIRWVLGEQSIKTLRGSKMQDVIFSGTEKRKSLNYAEVSLILDNSDKDLPIEYSEVNISRRIYRSGENEYFINKVGCRLKDIHELFMDTGVGRDGYSIIGQGKIDEILSSKSEDRRNIFEEAAGIMKYKTRKVESERKLESTRQNILRINDIISELELQLDPLKEQSEKAKKYLALAEKLKVLEVNLFIDNYEKLNQKLEVTKKDLLDIEKEYDEFTKKLENADNLYNDYISQNKIVESSILQINQEILEIEKQFEKFNSDIIIANEKIVNSNNNKDRIIAENNLLQERKISYNDELSKKSDKISEFSARAEDINQAIYEKKTLIDKISEELSQSINEIEDLKSDIIEKHNEISSRNGTIKSLGVLLDNVNKRKEQIKVEINDLDNNKKAKLLEINELEKIINYNLNQTKEIIKNIEDNNKVKVDAELQLSQSNNQISKMKDILNQKNSRYSLLKDMDKEYQGFNKSVKSILKECEKSNQLKQGIHGALAQLIKTEEKYETAIEVALGGALQNIVCDDENNAKNAIEFLKKNKLGRATFLPISSVSERDFNGLESILSNEQGYIGIASVLLEYNSKYCAIIRNLLGKVLIIDNIENGIKISKKYKYSFKVVTLEGEVFSPGGSLAGGSTNQSTSILGRSREINELSNEIKNLEKDIKKEIIKNEELIQISNKANTEIEKHNDEKRKIELLLVEKQSILRQYNENIEGFEDRINTLNIERSQLEEQLNDANVQINSIQVEISNISLQIEEMTKMTSLNQESYNNQVQLKDDLLNQLTENQIVSSEINHDIVTLRDSIIAIEQSVNDIDNQLRNNKQMLDLLDDEISKQLSIIEIKKKENQESILFKEQKATQLKEKSDYKLEIQQKTEYLQKSWKDYNNQLNDISERRSKIELKNSKYEMELETLQNKIWEDYEITYTKCLELKQDLSDFGNPNKALKDIKDNINSLGNVNLDSIEEYHRVKERYEFLSNQRQDLNEAEKSLRKVINDMLKIMREQFIEQFEIINNNFNLVFKELFGGGRAYLKLLDEENVLECGIEIEAQPPGKKLQNLNLLSGGERALTGIAILFAILKVRPTPFCVLDEIEAALDDVNIYRFAEYIKRFTKTTQFVVITHRKGTMEAANSIYGVTMQEEGVSKMVSLKLEDIAS